MDTTHTEAFQALPAWQQATIRTLLIAGSERRSEWVRGIRHIRRLLGLNFGAARALSVIVTDRSDIQTGDVALAIDYEQALCVAELCSAKFRDSLPRRY